MADAARMPKPAPEIVIEAGRADQAYWHDLWRYRDLFQVLAWRDVAIRYKQTLIGFAWALIRPLLTTLVFTLIFGRLANLPSEGAAPYALMVLAGVLPWTFFAGTLSDASNSLISNANLISKVYFPRLIVPLATIGTALVDFAVGLAILLAMMIWYRFAPGWHIVLLPFFVALAVGAAVGPGLWIAALNVQYRDLRYVVPFAVQIGFYISPIGFSTRIIPDEWKLVYALNPMVGVIDGFRWCLLGGQTPIDLPQLALSLAVTALLLWLGLRRFRRTEKAFADLI